MSIESDIVSKLMRLKKGSARADLTKVLSNHSVFASIVRKMATPFADDNIDIVVGIEASGIMFASGVAHFLRAGFVLARKEGRENSWTAVHEPFGKEYTRGEGGLEIVDDAVALGQRILIVDDFLETGIQLATAMKLIERLGGKVVGASFFQANRTREHTLKFPKLKVRDFNNEDDIPV